MRCFWAPVLLLFAASLTLACGSGSGRQLQSITLTGTWISNTQFELVATGHFSAAPTTVTPLPVFWSLQPSPTQYTLSTQPYVTQCAPLQASLTAWAPVNPNAPSSGMLSSTKMLSVSYACPDV